MVAGGFVGIEMADMKWSGHESCNPLRIRNFCLECSPSEAVLMDFFRCCLLCSSWTALLPSQNHRGSVSDVLPLCKHGIPGRGNGRFPESRICFLARRRGVVRLSFLITVKINMRGVDINDQCRSLPGPGPGKDAMLSVGPKQCVQKTAVEAIKIVSGY